jgi:predicted permease
LISLQNELAGPVRQASWVLAVMTLLVLLTACANVAQLLLSRTNERHQELELRAALGASRARLLQQLTTEATILTTAGALLGLLVAQWTSKLTSSIIPPQLATQQYTILDWRVLAFAAALALLLALAFGVLPAWLLGRLQPSGQMIRSHFGSRDFRTKRARATLVAVQAALTLTLVTSSLAMGRTFLELLRANLGFHTAGVVTLNVSLQGTKHHGPAEWQYYSEALRRLRSVPGVQAAGAISHLPLTNDFYMAGSFKLDSLQTVPGTVMNAVTPDYFRTMETRFLAGRDFVEANAQVPTPSVIVNEAFAKSAGLGKAIIGRTFRAPWGNTQYRIVGLVATTSLSDPAYQSAPQIYFPIEEEPPPALTLVARVSGSPEAYLAQCRDAVRVLDKQVPIYDVKTLDRRLADALSRPRFYTTAILFLAGLGLLLAAVGIYGTAAYAIAQRRSEMGVRMALGATYERLRTMMVRESLLPVFCGIALGVAGSLAAGRYLGHLVEGAALTEPWLLAVAAGIFLLVGLLSAWRATSRVLAIDPAEAIRAE